MAYIAHTKNQSGKQQGLEEHSRLVAQLASQFAASFGAGELAKYLGLWHDVGKFNPAFQQYLLECEANPTAKSRGPDHKAAGAQIALEHLPPLAMLVQGHHGGLKSPTEMQTWLAKKLAESLASKPAIETARRELPDLEPTGALPTPAFIESDPTAAELFLRMLFSALVDADYLDTERHFYEQKSAQRGSQTTMEELWGRLEESQRTVSGQGGTMVAQARHEIYQACLSAAEQAPGFFRLTVPTGGGKTRSAMAFALRHAMRHGHERVIVAVPFISITEQTASTYRQIFERHSEEEETQPIVLEHHSGGHTTGPEEDFHPLDVWQRLAAENWDAPIVVTTTVQLFESLFASSTSHCRKLHRLARSVIILDEAQALPPHLLRPILDALQQLCKHYGTTVVISTATQPAFDTIPDFASVQATEIVPDPARYFRSLKRVDYTWRTDPSLPWGKVAQLIDHEPQALAIVNTKKDALALLDALDDPNALHLSTLLCGAHRRRVIEEVKRRLSSGAHCRLVSTQVIEAGVDLDFPLVLRALGPLDGIIQAAGRCNREGKLERGRVVVFRPEEGGLPGGAYRTGTGITGALLGQGDPDPDDPELARLYFQRLFATLDIDRESIQRLRAGLDYSEVSQRFRMIEDDTESVIVSYGSNEERRKVDDLLARLRFGGANNRMVFRKLQPYIVSLRTTQANKHRDLIQSVCPGLGVWIGKYDSVRGITSDLDPDMFIA